MTNVNAEELKLLDIPLPDLIVQNRIFGELSASVSERDRLFEEADERLASIDSIVVKEAGLPTNPDVKKVFGLRRNGMRGTLTPERYSVVPLEQDIGSSATLADAGELVRLKVNPSKGGAADKVEWIRIDDLENEPTGVTRTRILLAEDIQSALIEVRPGDLLVARLGPTILNGKIVLAPSSGMKLFASAEFLVVRVNPSWDTTFLLWLLKTRLYRKIMYARSGGGTPSRYRLDATDFLSIPVPVIPINRQREIAIECESAVADAIRLREQAHLVWQNARQQFEAQLLNGIA